MLTVAGARTKRQVDAVVLKDEVLRLVEIPLIIRMAGMPAMARGAQVRLEILRWDELDLSVEALLLRFWLGLRPKILGDEIEESEAAEGLLATRRSRMVRLAEVAK